MLLSIAIPTYNRANYLDIGLKYISAQYNPEYNIEILISDNASTDDTASIVSKYKILGLPIVYIRNEANLGPDKNIAQCYLKAAGKYVLVLGDDDILLDGAIETICDILKRGEYGLVYLNFYGFVNDPLTEKPRINLANNIYLHKYGDIFKVMRSNVSFTSSNIINKKFINEDDIAATTGTNLNQIPGIINAAVNSAQNVYIGKYLLAQQMNNSGGYDYLKVFGTNFITVVARYIQIYGANGKAIERQKKMLYQDIVISLFPEALFKIKKEQGKDAALKKYNHLSDILNGYAILKIFNYPIIKFPSGADYIFLLFTKVVRKILFYYYKLPQGGRQYNYK